MPLLSFRIVAGACRMRSALVAALLAALAPAIECGAQTYPANQIRIVVPFTPGGGTDILARLIGQRLTESWGQPVIVDNRPGASGTLGTAVVARAAADGHTLLIVPAGY